MAVGALWLSGPTRVAGLSRRHARIGFVLLAVLLALCLTSLLTAGPPPVSGEIANRADDQRDIILYEGIVEALRHGGEYYSITADALRAGGYPLRPFVTFRLPTLAMAEAALPPLVIYILLYGLALATVIAWGMRLRRLLGRWQPIVIGLALLAGGMMAFVQHDLWAFHEIWAGLLVALSLALRRPGRWIEPVALGLIAGLLRETSGLYLVIMAALAWRDGERREALGWAGAAAVLLTVLGFHAWAVSQVVTPLDTASPGWAGLLGFGFFVKAMTLSTALSVAPAFIAALLAGLSLFGWLACDDPLALRVFVVTMAYAVVLSLFGRPDTFYWALIVAPAFPIGLVFVPDGLRDLRAAARGERRRSGVTVTRISR